MDEKVLDILCGPCQKERMSVKATLLCVTCKEPFCNNCTKLHRAQSWAQKHSYMSLSEESKQNIKAALASKVDQLKQKANNKKNRWKDNGDKASYMEDLQQNHDHSEMEMENEVFCEQHQSIVCDLCKPKEHKNCVNFTAVADVANAKKSSRDLVDLIAALKKCHKFADLMYQDRVKETDILEEKREVILQQLTAERKKSKKETYGNDKSAIADFESMHKRNIKKLSQEKERLTNLKKMTKADVEEMKEVYKDDPPVSPARFVKVYIRISNKRTIYERFLREIYDDIHNYDYEVICTRHQDGDSIETKRHVQRTDTYFRLPPFMVFEMEGRIGAKVKAISKFAGILAQQRTSNSLTSSSSNSPLISERPDSFGSASIPGSGSTSSSSSRSSGVSGGSRPLRLPSPPPERALSVNTFVPYSDDENQAFFITAIGCLPSGDLAIIDRCASELKVHDGKLRASACYTFQSLPWDLAILPDLHFAVTLPGEKIVKIVKMVTVMKEPTHKKGIKNNRQTPDKKIPTNELVFVKDIPCTGECWGVVYCDKSLYVTCDPWLSEPYILHLSMDNNSKKGTVVPVKGIGFTAPQHMSCNSLCTEIYVTDSALHCVFALGRDGQLKFVYRARDMGCPTGLSVDRTGNIFVCAKETSNIHRIAPGGNKGCTILDKRDGVNKPRGICYSQLNGNLYVANNNTLKIKAYSV
ncbi:uncharacterized protein [Argopecten irradians]|uniref:uncharacterized protein n=1 Tax=Argopecten irradians TaxID=31199 RepID=UPI003710AD94